MSLVHRVGTGVKIAQMRYIHSIQHTVHVEHMLIPASLRHRNGFL